MDVTGGQGDTATPPSRMSAARFLDAFGWVYENSSWIAQAAFDRGLTPEHDDPAGLASLMAAVVADASADTRLALLRAHPDLAGRLALAGGMTASSVNEQASAGLDQCTPGELAEFQDLNTRYTGKFGFPFILAVRGYDRLEILGIFADRLRNTPDAEFGEALQQVNRIAELRIRDHFAAQPH